MNDNLTSIERLDYVLKYFIEMNDPPFKRVGEIKDALGYPHTKEIYEIFHKLEKDGFINVDTLPLGGINVSVYGSTFDGRLFYMQGGYKARSLADAADAEQQLLEINRLKSVAESNDQNQKRLNTLTSRLFWATIAATLVAALVLFWYVWSYYHPQKDTQFGTPINIKIN